MHGTDVLPGLEMQTLSDRSAQYGTLIVARSGTGSSGTLGMFCMAGIQ